MAENQLLKRIREGRRISHRDRYWLAFSLALPAMMSQLSVIVMEYIDASMVGSLGAAASASIGLVSTTIWLFGGVSHSASTGFYVQVAHLFGADDIPRARAVFRQAIVSCTLFCLLLVSIGVAISPFLPHWLGGNEEICRNASIYFALYCLSMPLHQLSSLFAGVLRCSGDLKTPAMLQVMGCALDVVFNMLFIFGMGLGVMGAALGTIAAQFCTAAAMGYFSTVRSPSMNLLQDVKASFRPTWPVVRKCLDIAAPMGIEHFIMCGAQIVSTIIVAPLGTIAIAANAFGITIESLCYMPGYGIADAATTLVGQSIGAQRTHLARSFANITVLLGIGVMSFMAVLMYMGAPFLMQLMTPSVEVQQLTTQVLRIEAFAEPMFAASIVAYGVFVGAGDTKIPCTMNLFSIWAVRITLAYTLVYMGLPGVWIAMAIELCFRGIIMLLRLRTNAWIKIK